LQKAYPETESMLDVITPGVDTVAGRASAEIRGQARRQLGLPDDAVLLLFVGNDLIRKGLPTLLQALVPIPIRIHLAVVGQGDALPSLKSQVERLGLGGRVHFLGSQRDMKPAYRAADVLIHPTREDSYGMVVLEAMAQGLPVVVSDTPFCGIAQDLQHGENALLLKDPSNVPQLTATLRTLLEDKDLADRLSVSALTFAQGLLWDLAASKTEAGSVACLQHGWPRGQPDHHRQTVASGGSRD
jgi:UDP-glucose:(heptosyl)LPS alpha-1,3-glucosyltransferase